MTESEYAKVIKKIFVTKMYDIVDKEFLEGLSLLSNRKKNKIKKWVLKALAKKHKTIKEK